MVLPLLEESTLIRFSCVSVASAIGSDKARRYLQASGVGATSSLKRRHFSYRTIFQQQSSCRLLRACNSPV